MACVTHDYDPNNVKTDERSAELLNMCVRSAADRSDHGLGAAGWVMSLILLRSTRLPLACCCSVYDSFEFVANLKV
jgi:hypothetical protein